MRLALISTPRSGNTWLRYLLADLYGLQPFAVHHPGALDWCQLPEDCIVQMHWRRTDEMVRLLDERGFRVVTIKRHPLDVLVSILHFCGNEPQTSSWLLGEGGNEDQILHKSPTSIVFLTYAVGSRAKALLSVTAEWWGRDGVTSVCYEDLVHNPIGTLSFVQTELGAFKVDVDGPLSSLTFDRFKPTSQNEHFWQGRPGLGQRLLPREVAEAITEAHANTFQALEYRHASHDSPDAALAMSRWREIA